MQRHSEAQRPQQAHIPTPVELLAQERRQEEAARAQRAQLVHSAMPNGGGVMKRLKERAARQDPTTSAEKWHARLNGLPKPMDGKRREAFEALVRADVMALAETGRMDPMLAVDTMHAAVGDGTLGQGILAQDRQLLLDVLDHLAVDRLYTKLKLKISPDTLPAFTNAQVLEKPRVLGSGYYNTVFAVKVAKPDGQAFDAVFKPLKATENGWIAVNTGIPENDPQIAMRNIATVSYAKKLGFDVIVETQMALIDTGRGAFDSDLGLIMERARGKSARHTDAIILARPDVCVEVTKLQLLDHLTGQGDRTDHNYFIHIEPNGRARVMGIDNDQCFGKNLTDPAGIKQISNDRVRSLFHGTGLPPVVDTTMELAINGLTKRDLRSMLGDKLNEAEIEAAVMRHQGVKDHIAQLRSANRVIDPRRWGDANVQRLLNGQNSYVGREREWARLMQSAH